jgi:uncharacterized LabA/DUF88 family protein
VDAGYLLGAAGTLLAGDPDRSALEVDYPELASALIEEAQRQCGLPVLRLLWYDGAFNSQPSPDHRSLRVLPDVKVRLGELVVRGGRVQQKGVDSYLQRDLVTLARNRAVADAVLLGGDEDLRRALEEAQDFGTRVHLWGVEAAAPEYNQSQSLIAETDRRWVMSAEWVRRFVRLKPRLDEPELPHVHDPLDAPEAAFPPPAPPAAPAPVASEPPPSAPEDMQRQLASPQDLERLAEAFARDGARTAEERLVTTTPKGWGVTPAEHHDIPRLREITTSALEWRDNEEDATTPGRTPQEIGYTFGTRWIARAFGSQIASLVDRRPRAPNYLDGEFLRYAEGLGVDTWENESAKHAVRAGFWTAVDSLAEAPRSGG